MYKNYVVVHVSVGIEKFKLGQCSWRYYINFKQTWHLSKCKSSKNTSNGIKFLKYFNPLWLLGFLLVTHTHRHFIICSYNNFMVIQTQNFTILFDIYPFKKKKLKLLIFLYGIITFMTTRSSLLTTIRIRLKWLNTCIQDPQKNNLVDNFKTVLRC